MHACANQRRQDVPLSQWPPVSGAAVPSWHGTDVTKAPCFHHCIAPSGKHCLRVALLPLCRHKHVGAIDDEADVNPKESQTRYLNLKLSQKGVTRQAADPPCKTLGPSKSHLNKNSSLENKKLQRKWAQRKSGIALSWEHSHLQGLHLQRVPTSFNSYSDQGLLC